MVASAALVVFADSLMMEAAEYWIYWLCLDWGDRPPAVVGLVHLYWYTLPVNAELLLLLLVLSIWQHNTRRQTIHITIRLGTLTSCDLITQRYKTCNIKTPLGFINGPEKWLLTPMISSSSVCHMVLQHGFIKNNLKYPCIYDNIKK